MFMPSAVTASISPLVVDVSPPSSSHSGAFPITSSVFTCTVSGGARPLSYQWTRTSTSVSGSTFSIGSPTAPNTTFTMTGFGPGTVCTDVYRCTVTDQAGKQAFAECMVTWTVT